MTDAVAEKTETPSSPLLKSTVLPVSSISSSAVTLPPAQTITIDDDNFISNGEALFHISDLKAVIKGATPPPNVQFGIAFHFFGFNMGFPFADIETRDAVYDEVTRRIKAIKNGTINSYISKMKRTKVA